MTQRRSSKIGLILIAAVGIALLGGGASFAYLASIGIWEPRPAELARERSAAIARSAEPPAAIVARTWFDDIAGPAPISPRDQRFFVRQVSSVIFTGSTAAIEIPESLTGDTKPRIVFLSLSDGRSRARVLRGQGRGMRSSRCLCGPKDRLHRPNG